MLKTAVAFACLLACLSFVGGAAAGPKIGFAEDGTKYGADGGASLFDEMNHLGTTTNRMAVFWNSDAPTTIQDYDFLQRSVPVAIAHGIQVVFAIYPRKPMMVTSMSNGAQAFCAYAAEVATAFPQVTRIIVGNEPNQPRFWQPIFDSSGQPAAPVAMKRTGEMEALLDACGSSLPRGERPAPITSIAGLTAFSAS